MQTNFYRKRIGLLAMAFVVAGLPWLNAADQALPPSDSKLEYQVVKNDAEADGPAAFTDIGRTPHTMKEELAVYYKSAVEVAKLFAPENKSDDLARKEALATFMSRDKNRAADGILNCLNSQLTTDAGIRLGALKVIEAAKLNLPAVSTYLGSTALKDPIMEVRKAAIGAVKARKDDLAIAGMLKEFLGAYNEENGALKDAALRDSAVSTFRELGDKRVLQALQYYVTQELRLSKADLKSFTTINMQSVQIVQGTTAAVVIPIALPIQFPDINLIHVRTTCKCPASSALEDLTGQSFGMDANKWAGWIAKQP